MLTNLWYYHLYMTKLLLHFSMVQYHLYFLRFIVLNLFDQYYYLFLCFNYWFKRETDKTCPFTILICFTHLSQESSINHQYINPFCLEFQEIAISYLVLLSIKYLLIHYLDILIHWYSNSFIWFIQYFLMMIWLFQFDF